MLTKGSVNVRSLSQIHQAMIYPCLNSYSSKSEWKPACRPLKFKSNKVPLAENIFNQEDSLGDGWIGVLHMDLEGLLLEKQWL